jgi:hypothetical protein
MKYIPFFILLILTARGCKDESPDLSQATLKYSAHSRGFYRDVIVEKKMVTIAGHNGADKRTEKIDDTKWKEFQKAFAELDPQTMDGLKAPSAARLYDGAAIAKLEVVYQGKTYESIDFDHGTPPAEIERMVNLMAEYVHREE